jgi:hypothetical protein
MMNPSDTNVHSDCRKRLQEDGTSSSAFGFLYVVQEPYQIYQNAVFIINWITLPIEGSEYLRHSIFATEMPLTRKLDSKG